MVQSVSGLTLDQLIAEPVNEGRSLARILEHVVESQGVYLHYSLGKVDGLSEALKTVRQGPEALPTTMAALWQVTRSRLEDITEAERGQSIPHGQVTWTARRGLRRMLEHAWEHLTEIADRLGRPEV